MHHALDKLHLHDCIEIAVARMAPPMHLAALKQRNVSCRIVTDSSTALGTDRTEVIHYCR